MSCRTYMTNHGIQRRHSVNRIMVALAIVLTASVCVAVPNDGLDDRDIVLHAGGVIELRPPLGWRIEEIAHGREIRLVFVGRAQGGIAVGLNRQV